MKVLRDRGSSSLGGYYILIHHNVIAKEVMRTKIWAMLEGMRVLLYNSIKCDTIYMDSATVVYFCNTK